MESSCDFSQNIKVPIKIKSKEKKHRIFAELHLVLGYNNQSSQQNISLLYGQNISLLSVLMRQNNLSESMQKHTEMDSPMKLVRTIVENPCTSFEYLCMFVTNLKRDAEIDTGLYISILLNSLVDVLCVFCLFYKCSLNVC